MNRLVVLCVLLSLGCSKGNSTEGLATAASSTAVLPASIAPIASRAVDEAKSTMTGRFAGTFKAVRRASGTTKKEGAPAVWEQDDGKKLTGEGKVTLTIGADGQVQGQLTGALGEPTLRGRLEGDSLRAQIVAAGEELSRIQNGTLSLQRDGQGLKGTLIVATGDALVMRQADVVLSANGS